MKFKEVVKFRSASLFDGAIDLDCYLEDREKSVKVAKSFIFHGSKYHVTNDTYCKRNNKNELTDTIAMTKVLVDAVNNKHNKMMLSIAGFGAGKSHFAVTIANLLNGTQEVKSSIIKNINFIEKKSALEIQESLHDEQKVLILPINGMRNNNLQDEFFKITKASLMADGVNIDFLDKYDSRFSSLIYQLENNKNEELINKVINNAGFNNLSEAIAKLKKYDAISFDKIYLEIKKEIPNIPIQSNSEKELKDLIPSLYEDLCGENKPYKSILIIFDEFGKYLMFAAEQEAKAGNGIMQQLFEGVTARKDASIVLWGLSQLDLKEYQDSTNSNRKSIQQYKSRYVSRYDSAKRYFLSVSLESLISNLIDVNNPSYIPNINIEEISKEIDFNLKALRNFFPDSKNYSVWSFGDKFKQNIVQGCWPMDIYALWLVIYLSNSNHLLQQRSSMNIIKDCFENQTNNTLTKTFKIYATDLYNYGLGIELENSERMDLSLSQIATDYNFITGKYVHELKSSHIKVLEAIVLQNKLSAKCRTEEESKFLIEKLTGLSQTEVEEALIFLTEELNVVGLGINYLYELNSDAPSQNSYNKIINEKYNKYINREDKDENFLLINKLLTSNDFVNKYSYIFNDVDTDFGKDNNINSIEWKFRSEIIVSVDYFNDINNFLYSEAKKPHIKFDDPKGVLIYLVIPSNTFNENVRADIKQLLIQHRYLKTYKLPIIIFVIEDIDDKLLNNSIQYESFRDLSSNDKEKYKVFIDRDQNKNLLKIETTLKDIKRKRICIIDDDNEVKKLRISATNLFKQSYSNIIPYQMDFSTSKSKSPNEIKDLISKLLFNSSYSSLSTSMTATVLNHILKLVKNWGYYQNSDTISKFPENETIKKVFSTFDKDIELDSEIDASYMYDKLLSMPYGLNTSIASLLLVLYYVGRLSYIESYYLKKNFPLKNLTNKPKTFWFDTKEKGLKRTFLNDLKFVKIINDSTKWNNLIDEWELANKYTNKMEYAKISNQLINVDHITVPLECQSRLMHLNNEAEEAQKKLKEYWEIKTLYSKEIEKCIKRESIYRYAKLLAELVVECDKLFEDDSNWTEEELNFLREQLDYYKNQQLNNYFDKWIKNNSILNPSTLDKYTNLSKYFRTLGILEYSNILLKKIEDYNKKLKVKNKYDKILDSFYNELKIIKKNIENNNIYNYNQYLEYKKNLSFLNARLAEIDSLELSLINTNFEKEEALISSLLKKLDYINSSKESLLNNIYENNSITTINEINIQINSLISLQNYYMDNKENLEDLKDLLNALNNLKKAFESISLDFESYEGLAQRYNENSIRVYEIDEDLGLNYKECLKVFYNNYLQLMENKSHKFIQDIFEKTKNKKDMNIYDYILNIHIPLFITTSDLDQVKAMKIHAEEKISEQRVKYLCEQIKHLNESELAQLKKMLEQY